MKRIAIAVMASLLAMPAGAHEARRPAGASPSTVRPVAPIQALAITRQLLLRIDDAIRSGNYSVLRDLAAPNLRDTLTAADLAQLFAQLRQRNIELIAASVLEPVFSKAIVGRNGSEMLLEGFVPTSPATIQFSFVLRAAPAGWQLTGLNINLGELPPSPPRETVIFKKSLD